MGCEFLVCFCGVGVVTLGVPRVRRHIPLGVVAACGQTVSVDQPERERGAKSGSDWWNCLIDVSTCLSPPAADMASVSWAWCSLRELDRQVSKAVSGAEQVQKVGLWWRSLSPYHLCDDEVLEKGVDVSQVIGQDDLLHSYSQRLCLIWLGVWQRRSLVLMKSNVDFQHLTISTPSLRLSGLSCLGCPELK